MKEKKANNKNLNNQKKIIVIVILAVIILGLLLIGILKLTAKKQPVGLALDDFYSDDICRCLEHELNECSSRYELSGDVCINKTSGTYTNVIKGCSKYECSGIIYEYNFDIKLWEGK